MPPAPIEPPPAPLPDPRARTLLVTLNGPDRPGVTKALFEAASSVGAEVLDLEQVVVRGHLALSVLLSPGRDENVLVDRLTRAGSTLGMRVDLEVGHGDNAPRRTGRAAVVLMGAPLETHHVAAVAAAIADHGANIDRIRRLSRYPVTTVELDVSGADVGDLRQDLAMVAHQVGADIAVAPAGLARRGGRLVVMDVDSTLIQDEVIELLAEHAGRAAEVAAVTEAAMRGELDFAQSLHARVATLAGLPASVLDEVRDAVRLTPGARTLVRTLKRLGFTVAVVSGGFVEVVEPIARELGVDHVRANRLEVVDDLLTGRVVGRGRRPRREGRRPARVRGARGPAPRAHRRHRRRGERPRHAGRRRARGGLQRQADGAPPGRHRAERPLPRRRAVPARDLARRDRGRRRRRRPRH